MNKAFFVGIGVIVAMAMCVSFGACSPESPQPAAKKATVKAARPEAKPPAKQIPKPKARPGEKAAKADKKADEPEAKTPKPGKKAERPKKKQEEPVRLDVVAKVPGLARQAKQLELANIPRGKLIMGSPEGEPMRQNNEGPRLAVKFADPFYMGKFEVTNAQFERFVKDTGYKTTAEKEGEGFTYDAERKAWGMVAGATWRDAKLPWELKGEWGSHPVIMVSWGDAQAFCQWLAEKTGHAYRLPSAAEWEYACRAKTSTAWYWGDSMDKACEYANVYKAPMKRVDGDAEEETFPCDDGYIGPSPVGQLMPNAFGLYDMIGNVAEWCQDSYQDTYKGAPADGAAWETPASRARVVRGGSWRDPAKFCRSAARRGFPPDARRCGLGFRVCRD